MNPFTQKTIGSADAKVTNSSWKVYARNNASEREKRQKDEENKKWAAQELAKSNAVKAGGKLNPDGSVTAKKAGFFDLAALALNEVGSKLGEGSRNFIDDKILGEKGNDKFDSAKDVARLGLNLIPGMAEGLLGAGKNINEAVGGERFEKDDKGEWVKTEDLSGKQRAAAGVVAALDTVGLAAGGSGKFLKEVFKKPLDNAVKSAAKDVAKTGTKETAKRVGTEVGKTAGRSGIEGLEESIQSVASDIQDDDKLSDDWLSNAGKSFAVGAAAGGIFDVSGRAVGSTKNAAKTAAIDKATNTSAELRTNVSERLNQADELGFNDAQKKVLAERLTEEAQRANAIKDKDVRIQEFDSRVDTLMTEMKDGKVEVNEAEVFKDTITDEQAADLVRKDGKISERLAAIDSTMSKLQRGEDPEVRRMVAGDGTDVTATGAKFDADIKKLETQIRDLQQQAEGRSNNTGEVTAPEGVDPSEYTGDVKGRVDATEAITKLRTQIDDLRTEQAQQFEMLGGVSETIDTKAAASKMKELKREKYQLQDWRIKNNLGETQASLQEKLDDIDRGVVSDEFVQVREPAENVGEAVAMARETDSSDLSEIQRAATINEIHREAANRKLESLWTPEKAQEWEQTLDEEYGAREAEIREMPGPKQEELLFELNEEYIQAREDSKARLAEDTDDVLAAEQALKVADDIDTRIVQRANDILASNPTAFGRVDDENMVQIRSSIEVAKTLKKIEKAPETVTPLEAEDAVKQALRNTADAEEVDTLIEEDPRLEEATATVVADQVAAGNLKGSVWDYGFTTMRGGLLKLENGQQIVDRLHGALAEAGKSDARMDMAAKNDKWRVAYKTPEATEQSIAYWDEGKAISKLKGESDAQFEIRQKAVASVKKWLEDKAEEQGLGKERTRTNYFPHNFSQQFGGSVETVAEAIVRLDTNKNAAGNKLTDKQRQMYERKLQGIDLATRQRIEQAKIYKVGKNGHLEERIGAEGWSRDIPFVLEMYQRMSNKSAHIQPALDDIKKMTVDIEGKQLRYVEDVLNAATGKKSNMDEMLGDKTTKVMSTARRLNNMALMGASVRTIALQPFAILNNWRDAPNSKQFIISSYHSIQSLNPKNRTSTQPLVREFIEAGGMESSFSYSLKSTKTSKLENTLLGGISLVDRTLRLAAYDMGKHDYIKKLNKPIDKLTPLELEKAKAAGVESARKSQFGVGPLDIPLAQNNEVGKMVFQLQQFNLKQTAKEFSYLTGKEGVFRKSGWIDEKTGNLNPKGAKALVKTIAGYGALYALYTQMQIGDDEDSKNPFGFNLKDMLPFGEQLGALYEFATTGELKESVQAPIPPLISAAFGRGGQDKGIIGHTFRALTGGEDIDAGDELAGAMKSAIRNFVPGGTQGVRSYEGSVAVKDGESQNKSGSTRFLVDNDSGWNVIKGLLGGQYATTEGQEWLRKGMNTINKKHTVDMPDGSKLPVSEYVRGYIKDPEEKAAWIGYYATKQNAEKQLKENGGSREDKLKEIRLGLTAGTISEAQARREADKYNAVVRELYRPYYETIKTFPPRLADDYLEGVMINPQSATKPMKSPQQTQDEQDKIRSWYEAETLDPASGLYEEE